MSPFLEIKRGANFGTPKPSKTPEIVKKKTPHSGAQISPQIGSFLRHHLGGAFGGARRALEG